MFVDALVSALLTMGGGKVRFEGECEAFLQVDADASYVYVVMIEGEQPEPVVEVYTVIWLGYYPQETISYRRLMSYWAREDSSPGQ